MLLTMKSRVINKIVGISNNTGDSGKDMVIDFV